MTTNARKGKKIENLFKNSIKTQSVAIEKIKSAFNIKQELSEITSYRTGSDGGKNDVALIFPKEVKITPEETIRTDHFIGANVKSYKAGFNQVVRMHPDKFIAEFNVPIEIGDILKKSLIRKSYNPRREPFIQNENREVVVAFMRNKAYQIIEYSLCGSEKTRLFVLWNEKAKRMSLYLMKSVLEAMKSVIDVQITDRGVIKINPYFTIQKKGGNGHQDKRSRHDINHGGNNIQVKIKTDSFENNILPLCSYNVK